MSPGLELVARAVRSLAMVRFGYVRKELKTEGLCFKFSRCTRRIGIENRQTTGNEPGRECEEDAEGSDTVGKRVAKTAWRRGTESKESPER